MSSLEFPREERNDSELASASVQESAELIAATPEEIEEERRKMARRLAETKALPETSPPKSEGGSNG